MQLQKSASHANCRSQSHFCLLKSKLTPILIGISFCCPTGFCVQYVNPYLSTHVHMRTRQNTWICAACMLKHAVPSRSVSIVTGLCQRTSCAPCSTTLHMCNRSLALHENEFLHIYTFLHQHCFNTSLCFSVTIWPPCGQKVQVEIGCLLLC